MRQNFESLIFYLNFLNFIPGDRVLGAELLLPLRQPRGHHGSERRARDQLPAVRARAAPRRAAHLAPATGVLLVAAGGSEAGLVCLRYTII